MRPQLYFLPLLSAFLSVHAAPAETKAVWAGVHESVNSTHALTLGDNGLAKRDDCGSTRHLVNKNDIIAMANDLQNNNPNGNAYVGHQSWTAWTLGSASVCIHNWYLTENTHVTRWEAGWAVRYISDRCCNVAGNSQCSGGSCTAHGDSGLSLKVFLENSVDNCAYHS
ncbi:hypothetical protein BCR34DRAFT_584035 [Clohesyomyces aquaticus]|uniref:Uncharacterized protein n=1 Tax=Clohesyomyces aquaticus TaxID=1231657 RepID=A0A1Y2A4L8_9PLEO|nr:hypothetical protein BCR34DRAFT_584035 [Clohesyomyces aquaticus]